MEIYQYDENRDLEKIKEWNFFYSLKIQYDGDYKKENTFVAYENEILIGIGALFMDGTWYYIDRNVDYIPKYRMQMDISVREDYAEPETVECALVAELRGRMKAYKEKYPEKTLTMRCFLYDDERAKIQNYLAMGFSMNNFVPVMVFDLTGEIPEYSLPEGITIGQHSFEDGGMRDYMEANEKGFGNVADSEPEMWFRLGGDSTKVFVARDKDKIVAATTVWGIGNGRSATENIFTVPAYRRQNIARCTVTYALRYLKECGEKEASLTCVGDNLPAIALYESIGYRYSRHLIEMHDTI